MELRNQPERLNKVLAACGLGSRRHVESLISAGLVTIDGEIVQDLGRRVDPFKQEVCVEGEKLVPAEKIYYALNKPAGVYCTNAVEEKRTRAVDLIRDPKARRLFCVGRLDAESEGLIILTNDGEFGNRLTHPRYGVPKTYYVKVRGKAEAEALERAQRGVHLAEGRTGPMKIFVRKRAKDFTSMLVTIREGKNREIRRVFAKIGLAVAEIKRVSVGPLSIEGISPGHYRRLSPPEVRSLLAAAEPGARDQEPRPRRGR